MSVCVSSGFPTIKSTQVRLTTREIGLFPLRIAKGLIYMREQNYFRFELCFPSVGEINSKTLQHINNSFFYLFEQC